MTIATIAQVREAIAAALASLSEQAGVRVHATYPGQVIPPAVVVRRVRTSFASQFDGGDTHQMAVSVYVPTSDTVTAQELLDDLVSPTGPRSIIALLDRDQSLGGVVRSTNPTSVDEEGLVDLSGIATLSASVFVTVIV